MLEIVQNHWIDLKHDDDDVEVHFFFGESSSSSLPKPHEPESVVALRALELTRKEFWTVIFSAYD